RTVLGDLTGRALAKLETAGHAATPETVRRINATLEAISVSSPGIDVESPGRLTEDRDPPGFDVLSAWMPGSAATVRPFKVVPPKSSSRKSTTQNDSEVRARKEAVKNLLRQAEARLSAAR